LTDASRTTELSSKDFNKAIGVQTVAIFIIDRALAEMVFMSPELR
jgi:hypothetical protein